MGDDLGTRLVEDETCVTELAILGLAEANSNFIGPAIRVWGPPPLQSYDNESINKALRLKVILQKYKGWWGLLGSSQRSGSFGELTTSKMPLQCYLGALCM